MPPLSARHRGVAPDVVGFGYTPAPAGFEFGIDAWLQHVVDFLDALELERVSVIGNSFGGALALWLATTHPERVDRLVLMGSGGVSFPLTDGLEATWGFDPTVEGMRALLEIFAYDRSLVSDDLAKLRFEAFSRPGVREAYEAMFPAPRQRWIEHLAVPPEWLQAMPHETLIVHGRDDRVVPMSASLELASLIDRSQLHVFGRCGHWTQIERTARFVRLVEDFLGEEP
jgi:2-hydroxymuconate-semialdehyde hydrolase